MGIRGAFFMDTFDALGAIGLLMLAVGLYLVYPPLALIVPGVVILLLAVAGAARRGKE
jgi:hypothetical protein